jgi:hypothetical protein
MGAVLSAQTAYFYPVAENLRCFSANVGLHCLQHLFAGPAFACLLVPDAAHLSENPGIMSQRQLTAGILSAFIVVSLSAASSVSGQGVRRDTIPRAAQKPVVRNASVDSLVECTPVAAPVKKKPAVRRRKSASPTVAAVPGKVVAKAEPKRVATGTRRPIVRRARRVTPKPANRNAAHTTTIVMCRPVRPIAPLAQGTPTEQSVVPVPRLAPAAPPVAAPAVEEGPPLFVPTAPGMPVATAGGGRSWLPFTVIPALFIPFIHTGGTHRGGTPPIDSTTPIPPVIPPVIPPPTTVPEPDTLAMLGSGLLGLAGISVRKRRKRR